MANTAKVIDKLQSSVGGCEKLQAISINIDTVDTRIAVLAPSSADKRIYLVNLLVSEATAGNWKWTAESPNLAGTIATTNGNAGVTGTGTDFQNDFYNGSPNMELVGSAGDVIGISSVASATSLTLISNSGFTNASQTYKRRTTIWAPEVTTFQGLIGDVSQGFMFCTRPGDTLYFQSSALLTNMLALVCEGEDFLVR